MHNYDPLKVRSSILQRPRMYFFSNLPEEKPIEPSSLVAEFILAVHSVTNVLPPSRMEIICNRENIFFLAKKTSIMLNADTSFQFQQNEGIIEWAMTKLLPFNELTNDLRCLTIISNLISASDYAWLDVSINRKQYKQLFYQGNAKSECSELYEELPEGYISLNLYFNNQIFKSNHVSAADMKVTLQSLKDRKLISKKLTSSFTNESDDGFSLNII